jgi:glucose-1-phosphate thymidylyltransferase
MLGVKKVDDPRNFGVAEIDEEGYITKVIEKPSIPKSNMALVGFYKIKETDFMFSCLEKLIVVNEKGQDEFNLTDALECMMLQGARFKSFKVNNWFDCGKKETLLESNATLLKKFGGNMSEKHPFENTIIIPPVSIAEGCDIKNSVIGPNVAIGENTKLNHAIIKDSIIGSYSNLYEIVLSRSLIGSDAEVRGVNRSLNIGDNTAIDLSGGGGRA